MFCVRYLWPFLGPPLTSVHHTSGFVYDVMSCFRLWWRITCRSNNGRYCLSSSSYVLLVSDDPTTRDVWPVQGGPWVSHTVDDHRAVEVCSLPDVGWPTLRIGPSRGRRVFKFSRARYWSSSRRSSPAARAPSPLLEMRGFSKTSLWLSSGCHWLTKWSSTIYFAGAKKSGVRDSTGILLILLTDSVSRWHR